MHFKIIQNFTKYSRANSDATEEDLFAALQTAVNADGTLDAQYKVATIFSSWTRQAGFPLVTVERNYVTGDITLSQERYFAVNQTGPDPSLWWIPFNYAIGSAPDFGSTAATRWFSARSEKIDNLQTALDTDWLLVNIRQTGYYRVKYDLHNYKLLSEQLVKNHSAIHLTSRSQLIDDAFELARSERLGYSVVFDLIEYLEHELEYVPWASAFRGLDLVDRLYAGNATKYDQFNVSKNKMQRVVHIV